MPRDRVIHAKKFTVKRNELSILLHEENLAVFARLINEGEDLFLRCLDTVCVYYSTFLNSTKCY